MAGRLKRTAAFLSGTTYGSTAQALELIGKVRQIHDRVSGTLPDGRRYSANDPALLTWVDVAGSWSFLQSFLRHGPGLSAKEQDLYFKETARVAGLLGAHDLPLSRAEAETYLTGMRPMLSADRRTRIVARALLTQKAPTLSLEPFRHLIMQGGLGLLPRWAAQMHGLPGRAGPVTDAALFAVRRVIAWALVPTC